MIYMIYDFVEVFIIDSGLGPDIYFHYIGISMGAATMYILFTTDSST